MPLFALANAGIVLNTEFLARAYTSPVTLGIIIGYLVGKPLGTAGCAWLVTKLSHGRARPSVGWGAVAGAGTVAGIGFTVSLLIASLALKGDVLAEAKLGILSAVVAAAALTWVIFSLVNRLPVRARFRALLGTAEVITDLAVPVDPERDHIRGPEESMVTLVEYGDFECPYCGMAEPAVRELLRDYGEVRYVWRHLPLTDVHPNAQLAAEAAEAAARQGAFWEMHDLLLDHQDALHPRDLIGYADSLGLDTEPVRRRPAQARGDGARQRGPGIRRLVQCVRNSDILRQRQKALRRLRYRNAEKGGQTRQGPGDNQRLNCATRLTGCRVTRHLLVLSRVTRGLPSPLPRLPPAPARGGKT